MVADQRVASIRCSTPLPTWVRRHGSGAQSEKHDAEWAECAEAAEDLDTLLRRVLARRTTRSSHSGGTSPRGQLSTFLWSFRAEWRSHAGARQQRADEESQFSR